MGKEFLNIKEPIKAAIDINGKGRLVNAVNDVSDGFKYIEQQIKELEAYKKNLQEIWQGDASVAYTNDLEKKIEALNNNISAMKKSFETGMVYGKGKYVSGEKRVCEILESVNFKN